MANRRDLHVGLDADDRGFGPAFEDAKEKAQGLDRELAKLERQQAAQEKVTTRTTAAVDRFARAEDKAALSAHKMGLEAKRAAEQAEQAEVRAAAAAEAAEKGLLDKAKAAKIAARADDQVERAALKAAEAQRALAHAADQAADQERQLARDAQLAATAQRLGTLRASGAVREYNALLKQTRANHGSLAGTAVGDFKEITNDARKATHETEGLAAQFKELGAQWKLVGIVNGLALLPELASAGADAVTLGLGGAIAGVGLKFAASDKRIRAEYSSLGRDISASLTKDAAPFVTVLDHVAKEGRGAFKSWEPEIRDAWASMAPEVDKFVAAGIRSLDEFKPAFHSITRGFNAQLQALTPQLGGDARNIATGIKAIGDAAAKNPQALASLVRDLTLMVRYGGDAIGFFVRFKSEFDAFNRVLTGGGPAGLLHLLQGMGQLGNTLGLTGRGFQVAGGTFLTFDQQAAGVADVTSKLGKDLATLSDETASATDRANALSDAFARLLNPAEAVFTDTAKLKDGVSELAKALKKSHGGLTDNTAASRAAKTAFTGVIDGAKSLASDMLNSGKSIDQVRAKLNPYIHTLYAAAGSNDQARALVDRFVRSLGAVPLKKSTSLTLDDQDFLSRLHTAQGLKLDPKTGYLRGDNADYFNKWLKTNGLKINPKTGRFLGNNSDLYNKWLAANHLRIDPKTGRILGNTSAFWAAVHSIPSSVGSRYLDIYQRMHLSVSQAYANKSKNIRGYADGGIDRYADGGMRHDLPPHVVTRPTVLYGEPETGGEAFIPLGSNKRSRSVMLLSDVAQMFGLAVVRPATAMANGGIMAFADGGTTSASLSDVLQHWTDTRSPTTKKDVDAAAKARKTQINQLKSAEDALYRARHAHHKDARTIAADERRVAAERSDVADATKKLADVEQRYKYGKMSPATQLGSALGLSIKDTGAFISNLTTLASRGYGVLAQHLLAQGDATAEKTAADAVKMSSSKLAGLNKQVQQADQQQNTLANLGNILTIKSAMTGGANTWDQLISATGLAPNDLAAALKLMSTDLAKTAAGQALLAMMKAHGFARGGEITGPPGTDQVPLWGTAGEWVVPRAPAAANRQLLEAMTTGRPLPAGMVRGGDGASAGRPVIINVYARDSDSAIATAKATSHELGWAMKQGGS